MANNQRRLEGLGEPRNLWCQGHLAGVGEVFFQELSHKEDLDPKTCIGVDFCLG